VAEITNIAHSTKKHSRANKRWPWNLRHHISSHVKL